MLRRLQRQNSFDPRCQWLDPVATAPGSVPNPLFGVAQPNNSLDASGTSGLVIDNWSVTWLSPAASTQPLGRTRFGFDKMAR
jgi:hypothetical protein